MKGARHARGTLTLLEKYPCPCCICFNAYEAPRYLNFLRGWDIPKLGVHSHPHALHFFEVKPGELEFAPVPLWLRNMDSSLTWHIPPQSQLASSFMEGMNLPSDRSWPSCKEKPGPRVTLKTECQNKKEEAELLWEQRRQSGVLLGESQKA